jgi:tetratricopeptide (TPR) repeat protein
LALSHNNLATLLLDLGKPDKADAAYRQALGIQEKLAADFPAVPQYSYELALSHNNLGNRLHALGKLAEAEAAHRQALGIREKLATDFPAVPRYREALALSHNHLGNLLVDLRQWAEAETAYCQALDIQEKLAADFSAVPQYRIDLGGSQVNFGRLLSTKGQPEPALDWYAKAIATLEGVLREVKVDATARRFLCNAHWARAGTLVELSPEPEQMELRMRRAGSRVRAGQVEAATREAEELAKNANAVTLYNAACVFALAAARPDETGGALSKEACAKRAVALLRQAVAKDVKIAEYIEQDDDLKTLRQRDDFKQLLTELPKKSP